MHSSVTKKFPEDIECIVTPSSSGCGGIFISNIEVAENPKTLACNK